MKQVTAVKAYISAKKLNSQDVSPKTAKVFFELFRKLQSAWDFQVQEERKIFAKYPDHVDPITGKIKMEEDSKPEDLQNMISLINKDLLDLENVETEIDFEKVTINASIENLKISGEDIANLESFIEFD